MTTPEVVVIQTPESADSANQSQALQDTTNAAAQLAHAAAAVAGAAAASPENRASELFESLMRRLDTIENMVTGVHEKIDNLGGAIALLAVAEIAEAAEESAEIKGDNAGAEIAAETQAAAAGAAVEIVAEIVPENIPETPQMRPRSTRRFV